MAKRRLTNWLAAYAEHTAISEAPPEFHLWTGVSVIAGALRRRVWVDMKTFQWTPNFYIIMVAPPGVATKSTTMKIGYSILQDVPGVKLGPSSITWQGLLKSFEEAQVAVVDPGVSDPKDPMAERHPMSCVSCGVSELGVFLRPKDEELTAFLTDMWDGQKGSWERKLSTKEVPRIENPWLNVVGCTTPSWFSDGFDVSMIHGGLTSRCIFIWANKKHKLISYPSEQVTDDKFEKQRADLIHDLTEISQMFGEMKLSPEAIKWGTAWYERHWDERPKHLVDTWADGYIARKQTHIHKLAIIISAATSNEMTISKETLELADISVTAVERHMVTIFKQVVESESGKQLEEIMGIVRRYKTITRQTLWRHCLRTMDEQQFTAAINGAVKAGYLMVKDNKYMPRKQSMVEEQEE